MRQLHPLLPALLWLLTVCGCASRGIPELGPPAGAANKAQLLMPVIASAESDLNGVVPASYTDSQFGLEAVPAGLAPNVVDPTTAMYRPITLPEAVAIALSNSQVLRDLGGRIVSQPGQVNTQFNPELTASDARVGIDAALSAFDTHFSSSLLWQRNNRGLKLVPIGSQNDAIDQRVYQQRSTLSRRFRTGTQFKVQQGLDYDRDDLGVPPNRFASAFTPFVGAELRHSLGLGGGRLFNEVAGPGAQPGEFRGILIARSRSEIAASEYRIGLRDLLYNVVRQYWLLKFAHERYEGERRKFEIARDLEEIAVRKHETGLIEKDVVDVATQRRLASELVYQDAFSGPPERLISGILGPNGALLSGSELGVLPLERRLRFLLGMDSHGTRLLMPSEMPSDAPMLFDLQSTLATAFSQRPELLRQQTVVRQKQLELAASRNFLKPTVDLVSQFRVLGFGDNLFGRSVGNQDVALQELLRTDLKEWSAGVEVRWPTGNRIGHTAVRNATVALVRENAIWEQQRLQINHEVSNAMREVQRAHQAIVLNQKRLAIAVIRRKSAERKYESGIQVPVEAAAELESQEADAKVLVDLAIADYQIAIATMGLARGTLMQDLSVALARPAVEFTGTAMPIAGIRPPQELLVSELVPPTRTVATPVAVAPDVNSLGSRTRNSVGRGITPPAGIVDVQSESRPSHGSATAPAFVPLKPGRSVRGLSVPPRLQHLGSVDPQSLKEAGSSSSNVGQQNFSNPHPVVTPVVGRRSSTSGLIVPPGVLPNGMHDASLDVGGYITQPSQSRR